MGLRRAFLWDVREILGRGIRRGTGAGRAWRTGWRGRPREVEAAEEVLAAGAEGGARRDLGAAAGAAGRGRVG
jgi:hypothetical protein